MKQPPMPEHRFRILHRYAIGGMAEDLACEHLRVDQRTLRQLVSVWEPHLKKLVPLIDRLMSPANNKLKQTAIKLKIAELLSVSYRQVNRLISTSGIDVPAPKSVENREKLHLSVKNRRKMQQKCAVFVISGTKTVENAASEANLSVRQMYRLCSKLCAQAGVNFSDLKLVSPTLRERTAKLLIKTLDL